MPAPDTAQPFLISGPGEYRTRDGRKAFVTGKSRSGWWRTVIVGDLEDYGLDDDGSYWANKRASENDLIAHWQSAPDTGPTRDDLADIYIWFSDNGNIRKWSRDPFPEGTHFAIRALGAPDGRVCAKSWKAGAEAERESIARAGYLNILINAAYKAGAFGNTNVIFDIATDAMQTAINKRSPPSPPTASTEQGDG